MIDPEPNVIPRIIWGAIKNLLVKGYNTIRRAKKQVGSVKKMKNQEKEAPCCQISQGGSAMLASLKHDMPC